MISITQTTLSSVLNAVTRASLKSSIPALSIVRLDAKPEGSLHLSCFNGETAARAVLSLPCEDDFSVCVDAQTVKAMVETLEDEIRLSVTDNSLLIENGSNRTTLRLIAETIPVIGEESVQPLATLPGSILRSLMRVLPFASTDEARPTLSVLHLTFSTTSLVAQAADGYAAGRACETISGPQEPRTVCLPISFTRLLTGLVEEADTVRIGISGENHFIFQISNPDRMKDLTLGTVAAEQNFPGEQLAQLIEAAHKDVLAHLSVQKNSLAQTLRMVNAMGTQNTFLKAANGSVKMASEETAVGRARNILDGTASGQDASVWLSAAFLKRAADACKGLISITIAGDKKPLLLEEGSFISIIMPLFMENNKDPFAEDDEAIPLVLPAKISSPA